MLKLNKIKFFSIYLKIIQNIKNRFLKILNIDFSKYFI